MGWVAPLLVAVGGALGAVARYAMSSAIRGRRAWRLPMGTMMVNVIGCFVIGILFTTIPSIIGGVLIPDSIASASVWNRAVSLFLITGFCGGFTTFSTAMHDAVALAREGEVGAALRSLVFTLAFAVLSVSAGAFLGEIIVLLTAPQS
jgi:fluoride exporter